MIGQLQRLCREIDREEGRRLSVSFEE
uniref:Uncharacterized protein n=1 Tax=Anguilla anguilla TaxID=7936 RepID=A0A0E9VAA6_ANGAN